MPRRTPILTIVAAIALSAATAGVGAATAGPAGAKAAVRCYAANGNLYCNNSAPTPIYRTARYGYEVANGGWHPELVVDTLRTSFSYFRCWVRGAHHSGGNNVWYYTYGDDTAWWGYVPAVQVYTNPDPFPGVRAC